MKTGRKSFTTELPPATLERFTAMCNEPNRAAREIYNTLALEKFATFSTVRHEVSRRRRQKARSNQLSAVSGQPGEEASAQSASSVQSADGSALESLERQTIETALNGVVAGTVKVSTCASLLIAISALKGSRVRENSDDRAAKLFEVKLAELQRKQTAALATVAEQTGLTPEVLAEIKTKVLGI